MRVEPNQPFDGVANPAVRIISKKDAKEQGLSNYFTGRPCKNGHVSERRVSNGVCIECKRNIDKSGRADGVKAANNSTVTSIPMPVLDDSVITDVSRLSIDTCGIESTDGLTKEEWRSLVQIAEKSKTFRQWMLGDLWNSCAWGDKATHMESLGVEPKSAQEYGRVASRIPHDMRRPNLSFGHHQALCVQAVHDEQQMVSLLDRVEINGMSVRDTRRAVKNLLGNLTEGDLEGGDANGGDGTENEEHFNPFYGLNSRIKAAREAINTYTEEDVNRINEFKSWLEELAGPEAQ